MYVGSPSVVISTIMLLPYIGPLSMVYQLTAGSICVLLTVFTKMATISWPLFFIHRESEKSVSITYTHTCTLIKQGIVY